MPRIQTGPETHDIIDNPRCPICGQPAEVYRRKEDPFRGMSAIIGKREYLKAPPDLFEGFCERCGDVITTLSALEEASKRDKRHLVSAWLRQRPPNEPQVVINKELVDRILKDAPEYSVLEELDRTLFQIERMSDFPGQQSKFNYEKDYPLVYAKTHNEAIFYVRQLDDLGYVKENSGTARMTAKGYQRLSEIQRAGRESAFAFVAMWFDSSMNTVYDDAIEPAIRDAGYKPIRIDRTEHVNRIDDEIIGQIKRNRFMVADFTGQRPGVYFEAGMMLGLGRTVIWMCKKQELESGKVHFDTRQYNFIDYESIADAKKRLYDRIVAIEGEGPELSG